MSMDEWPDRACRDNPQLWDDYLELPGRYGQESTTARRKRHGLAILACLCCPALAECRRLDTTGMEGIVAGRRVG